MNWSRVDHLRIKHLRLLELIADTGSLSAAADRIALSQSAVTAMLQELENVFRTRLVERASTGARLNGAGAVALERLRHTLSSIEMAVRVSANAVPVPALRIGALPLTLLSLMPGAIRLLEAAGELPGMSLQIGTVNTLITALQRGELDCVLGMLDTASLDAGQLDGLIVEPVATDRLCVACATGHARASATGLSLHDLLHEQWVLPSRATYTRRMVEQRFLSAGVTPPVPKIESDSFHSNLAIVGATALLTVAPISAVRYYEAAGAVRTIDVHGISAPTQILFITHRHGADLASLRTLSAAVRRVGEHGGAN
jgi:molybdate transport repressor ModE-like protein